MESDPIVAEIRELREKLAARFNYNLRAIVTDAQQRDATGDRKVVRLSPRRPTAVHQTPAAPETGHS
jgi:hypothetical protein